MSKLQDDGAARGRSVDPWDRLPPGPFESVVADERPTLRLPNTTLPSPMTRSIALLALALSLAACDGGFSDSPGDLECRSGATMTGTADGRAFAATCVELSQSPSGFVVRGYTDPNSTAAESQLVDFIVGGAVAGTFPVNGATYGTYSSNTRSGSTELSTTLVAASAGEVVLSEVTGSRVRGTFAFTGREEVTPAGGATTQTGRSVAVSVTFDVPR